MGAMGWSFGGYMMDWFEGHTDRFKAIASMMGVFDLRSMYGSTEELWFPGVGVQGAAMEFGGLTTNGRLPLTLRTSRLHAS